MFKDKNKKNKFIINSIVMIVMLVLMLGKYFISRVESDKGRLDVVSLADGRSNEYYRQQSSRNKAKRTNSDLKRTAASDINDKYIQDNSMRSSKGDSDIKLANYTKKGFIGVPLQEQVATATSTTASESSGNSEGTVSLSQLVEENEQSERAEVSNPASSELIQQQINPIVIIPASAETGHGTTQAATQTTGTTDTGPIVASIPSTSPDTVDPTETAGSKPQKVTTVTTVGGTGDHAGEIFQEVDSIYSPLAAEEISEIPGTVEAESIGGGRVLGEDIVQAEFYPDEIDYRTELCEVVSLASPNQFSNLTFGQLDPSQDTMKHQLDFSIPYSEIEGGITEGREIAIGIAIFKEEGMVRANVTRIIWRNVPQAINPQDTFNFSILENKILFGDHSIRTRVEVWINLDDVCVNPNGFMKFAFMLQLGVGLVYPIPSTIPEVPVVSISAASK